MEKKSKKSSQKSKTPKSIEDFALRKLGTVLRRERERRHLSQLEVGKRMGKSKIAVHYYESAKHPIHFGTFAKICAAIRVSPGFVIDEWMKSDAFDVIDDQRRKEYHEILEEMIKYGFSRELDVLTIYYRGLVEKEKEIRRIEASKRKIDTYFPKTKRGDQDDDGI